MSDAPDTPLQAARALVGTLRAGADGAIARQLDALAGLLESAQQRGEGQDAAETGEPDRRKAQKKRPEVRAALDKIGRASCRERV